MENMITAQEARKQLEKLKLTIHQINSNIIMLAECGKESYVLKKDSVLNPDELIKDLQSRGFTIDDSFGYLEIKW